MVQIDVPNVDEMRAKICDLKARHKWLAQKFQCHLQQEHDCRELLCGDIQITGRSEINLEEAEIVGIRQRRYSLENQQVPDSVSSLESTRIRAHDVVENRGIKHSNTST